VVFFAAVFYVLLFGPLVLFVFLWKKLLSQTRDRTSIATAALISLSYGYLMAALVFRSVFHRKGLQ
jgi:predicted permease